MVEQKKIRLFLDDHDITTLSQPLSLQEAQGNLRAYFEGDKNKQYTIIMYDLDAPSPYEPTTSPYLHSLIVNIIGGSYGQGDVLMSYTPPSPPDGQHRYYVDLYQQEDSLPQTRLSSTQDRKNFPVTTFVTDNNLSLLDDVVFHVTA